jgi:DNA-binding phage protein
MALATPVRETLLRRMKRDPAYREGLLAEGIEALVRGETEVAKSVFRDYVHVTGGFEKLGEATGINSKVLHRMLGPKGNPTMRHVGAMLAHFTRGRRLAIQVERRR